MRRKLVAGNWKMHGSRVSNAALLAGIVAERPFDCEVTVCVPFPYLEPTAAALAGTGIHLGAQDCSIHAQGAFTGEVSAGMLADFGCRHAIVGHSERRAMHGETDRLVADKARAVLASGLVPIVCVGETPAEHAQGIAPQIVRRQLSAVVEALGPDVGEVIVAYEPIWAVGTGVTASPEQAQEMHALIRAQLRAATPRADAMCLLYGGSVKPENAAALMAQADIDGGLIGAAALKAADFVAICRAASTP